MALLSLMDVFAVIALKRKQGPHVPELFERIKQNNSERKSFGISTNYVTFAMRQPAFWS